MSDTPDRIGLLDRGTGDGLPFCGDPAPHSNLAGVDQETASTSAPSEDCLDFFDWDAFERDRETDATTHSDAPSEGNPAATPAPAGPGTNHGDDCPMPDAPSPEGQLVWPQVPGPHPPRDTNFQVEASPSPPQYTEMHLDGHSPTPLPPSEKKTRVVKNPEETNQVRELGSCYHCKMNKIGCNPAEVCGPCHKLGLECIRKPLQNMIPSTFTRWNFWNDQNFLMPGCEQFAEGPPHHFFISCSDSTDSPCLKLAARPFALPNQADHGAQRRWGISPNDERPSQEKIYHWMEQQIWAETGTDFESEMDKLLLQFVRRPQTGTQWEGQQLLGPLLSNILRLRCMWKLWSCKRLFVRQQPRSQAYQFGLQLVSIQDSLRLFAAQAISELERKILPVIDKCCINVKKDTSVMKWCLLWQMILVYRQSLSCVLGQQQTEAAPIPIEVMPMNEGRHIFLGTSKRLFEAIVVIYCELFKTKAAIERIRDAGSEAFGGDGGLHGTYQRVWQKLPDFYQQVWRQHSPTDELFIKYIVAKGSGIPAKARVAHK